MPAVAENVSLGVLQVVGLRCIARGILQDGSYKCKFGLIGYGEILAAANNILSSYFSFCIFVSLPVLVIYTIKQIKIQGN